MKLNLKLSEAISRKINNSSPLLTSPRAKRVVDVILSAVALLLMLPVFIIIAITIKIDSHGPVFYWQERVGKNGGKFSVIKFRTMTATGHPVKKEDYVKKQDHRITRIGRFLRNSSMDELPQLINVLKGEMSIVGPRPQAIPQVQYYLEHIPGYNERHLVKPGLTGLVQISDLRSEVRPEEQNKRLKLDIYYINNWSIWFDFFIIFRTIAILLPRYSSSVAIYGSKSGEKGS